MGTRTDSDDRRSLALEPIGRAARFLPAFDGLSRAIVEDCYCNHRADGEPCEQHRLLVEIARRYDEALTVTFCVAMEAAAPPIATTETRIERETAEKARSALETLEVDWREARVRFLSATAAQREERRKAVSAAAAAARSKAAG